MLKKKRQNKVKRYIFWFDEVKKHTETSPDVQFKEFSLKKQETRPITEYELIGKTIRKNPIQKTEKTVKIKVKLPHVNKKTTSEKANFCSNTVFSLYFKFRAKKSHAAKTTRFFAPLPVSA